MASEDVVIEAALSSDDQRIAELTDEVTRLRQSVASQSTRMDHLDALSLPPALLALLQPHTTGASSAARAGSTAPSASDWSLLAAGLAQKTRLLQEENDELYDKLSETANVKLENKSLRRVISKLERALTEAHTVVDTLSTELSMVSDALLIRKEHGRSESRTSMLSLPSASSQAAAMNININTHAANDKPIPTGPRAQKKPRLSESRASPEPSVDSRNHRPHSRLPSRGSRSHNTHNTFSNASSRPALRRPTDERPRSPAPARSRNFPSPSPQPRREASSRARTPVRDTAAVRSPPHHHRALEREHDKQREMAREGDRERERERTREPEPSTRRERDRESKPSESRSDNRERKREKERQRDRIDRTNTSQSRRDGRGGQAFPNGDRTLAERMGL